MVALVEIDDDKHHALLSEHFPERVVHMNYGIVELKNGSDFVNVTVTYETDEKTVLRNIAPNIYSDDESPEKSCRLFLCDHTYHPSFLAFISMVHQNIDNKKETKKRRSSAESFMMYHDVGRIMVVDTPFVPKPKHIKIYLEVKRWVNDAKWVDSLFPSTFP